MTDMLNQDAAGMALEGYNFAYLDEQTKRMIRRALLKALAIPGYQVPFASREMPMPYGWGTGGIQLTASVIGENDVLKVIDQGDDDGEGDGGVPLVGAGPRGGVGPRGPGCSAGSFGGKARIASAASVHASGCGGSSRTRRTCPGVTATATCPRITRESRGSSSSPVTSASIRKGPGTIGSTRPSATP